jgi:hypothetical protein
LKGRFRTSQLFSIAPAANHQPSPQSMFVTVAKRGYQPFERGSRPAAKSALPTFTRRKCCMMDEWLVW